MTATAIQPIKLFYAPGACSLAPHITLEETGAAFTAVPVDFKSAEQRSDAYLRINPKGRVPALALGAPGDDWTLTEIPAILQFIAQAYPAAKLWPTTARAQARCLEWMAWMSSGVHVTYAHVRRAERYASSDAALADVRATGMIATRKIWTDIEHRLATSNQPWAAGTDYSVADPYLFVFWSWGRGEHLKFDMAKDFPAWTAHAARMLARPAVRRALAREGLSITV
jgi:glutathione S-transferase